MARWSFLITAVIIIVAINFMCTHQRMVIFCLLSTQEVTTGTRNCIGLNSSESNGERGVTFQPVLSPQADENKGGWVGLQNLGDGFKNSFFGDSNQEETHHLWDS